MSTRLMSDEPTIYLAGPWFTEGQPERLAKIEKLMDELELTYYSPRLDGIDLTPDATEADSKRGIYGQCGPFKTGQVSCRRG